jgi:hypothetical protein
MTPTPRPSVQSDLTCAAFHLKYALTSMGCVSSNSLREVCCARIIQWVRQEDATYCVLGNRTRVRLPRFLASHIAIGDEITFPLSSPLNATGPEALIKKSSKAGAGACVYLAPISYVAKPKSDRRGQAFVSAAIRQGNLGISSVFLPCDIVRDHFYRNSAGPFEAGSLYHTLRVSTTVSLAELRVAFKLRALELKSMGVGPAEHSRLERAFNILGHPELRSHYDSLLASPEIPAIFPYGGAGRLVVAGERSRSGETFFAHRILVFVPDKNHRKFELPLRYCDFYSDKVLCRHLRRKLRFWLDPDVLRINWDPSWNRWKHLVGAKIEIEGDFASTANSEQPRGSSQSVNWETGLPSRLSVKQPPDLNKDIENTRSLYCRFGQYSRALDQIRLCLEHKAMERKELERMCSEFGIPSDFDVTQINWRPDYDPLHYAELSRAARLVYLFRDEYIFDLEKAVIVETPQLGHATYIFAKPRNMEAFLAVYTRTTKSGIQRNHENVAERLGFLRRVVHGKNPYSWLKNIRQILGAHAGDSVHLSSGCLGHLDRATGHQSRFA